ncbi:MAG: argininosuccinate lyase, partial [Verrucomicrobia bacterium]|nr:argininosuccinate lyase [Verrucomicrobiota bacterium]
VDYLVKKGVPFRNAHHAVGELVAISEKKEIPLNQLTLEDFKKVNTLFEKDILETFILEKAMDKKTCIGSGGTSQKQQQLNNWEIRLKDYNL